MDLATSLIAQGIDLTLWSPAIGNKSVTDLQAEIDAGETLLRSIDGKLVRTVKVVRITVRVEIGSRSFLVVEDKQIFFTGAVRERGMKFVAEKIKHDELPTTTARRALAEEIGLNFVGELVEIGEELQEKSSPSYPGLSSQYRTYNYQIVLSIAELKQIRFAEIQTEKMSLFTLEPI